MGKARRILTYAVTIAVIAAIAIAAITFLRRSMRDTVYLQDYALTLGSDDLFVNENSNIYRLAHISQRSDSDFIDYIYVNRIRTDDSITFFEEFNYTYAYELTPYGYAATMYSELLYVRGDGSVWHKDDAVKSGDVNYVRLKPFFLRCSSEELEPVEGHEVDFHGATGKHTGYTLSFGFTENRKLRRPTIRASVKLADGNWHLLNREGSYDYDTESDIHEGYINLPYVPGSSSPIPGTYRIEIYEDNELYTAFEVDVQASGEVSDDTSHTVIDY